MNTLKRCGGEIAGLISEAASRGEFELVVRLGSLAAQISSLADGLTPSKGPATPVRPGAKATVEAMHPKTVASQYPKFTRFDDQLVKIGWSRKEKTEYVHKAPLAAVHDVCAGMESLGKTGRRFGTEKLLSVAAKSSSSGEERPLYQLYVCLAWLRAISLVEQHGRNSYSIKAPSQLRSSVNRAWETLPAFNR